MKTKTLPPSIDIAIGANVRATRMKSGMSRDALADIVGIEPDHLTAIEDASRRASPAVLTGIAEAMGVSVAALRAELPSPEQTTLFLATDDGTRTLEGRLLTAFRAIADEAVRALLVTWAEAMARKPPRS